MGERWFVALPYRSKNGARLVDVRAKLVADDGMGSRFVCSTTPDDAERIVADHNASARLAESSARVRALEAALTFVGHPYRGGPNLCWCPADWSGPENHTEGCLRAFAALRGAEGIEEGE